MSELFSERVRRLRKKRHLTQGAVAREVGVSNVAVSYWESGTRAPGSWHLRDLARMLGVTTDYLLTGHELHGGRAG